MKKLLLIMVISTSCGIFQPKKEIINVVEPKKDRLDRNTDCVLKLMKGDALPLNAGTICNDIYKR